MVLIGGVPLVGPQEELRGLSAYTPRELRGPSGYTPSTSRPGQEAKWGFSGFIKKKKTNPTRDRYVYWNWFTIQKEVGTSKVKVNLRPGIKLGVHHARKKLPVVWLSQLFKIRERKEKKRQKERKNKSMHSTRVRFQLFERVSCVAALVTNKQTKKPKTRQTEVETPKKTVSYSWNKLNLSYTNLGSGFLRTTDASAIPGGKTRERKKEREQNLEEALYKLWATPQEQAYGRIWHGSTSLVVSLIHNRELRPGCQWDGARGGGCVRYRSVLLRKRSRGCSF